MSFARNAYHIADLRLLMTFCFNGSQLENWKKYKKEDSLHSPDIKCRSNWFIFSNNAFEITITFIITIFYACHYNGVLLNLPLQNSW